MESKSKIATDIVAHESKKVNILDLLFMKDIDLFTVVYNDSEPIDINLLPKSISIKLNLILKENQNKCGIFLYFIYKHNDEIIISHYIPTDMISDELCLLAYHDNSFGIAYI